MASLPFIFTGFNLNNTLIDIQNNFFKIFSLGKNDLKSVIENDYKDIVKEIIKNFIWTDHHNPIVLKWFLYKQSPPKEKIQDAREIFYSKLKEYGVLPRFLNSDQYYDQNYDNLLDYNTVSTYLPYKDVSRSKKAKDIQLSKLDKIFGISQLILNSISISQKETISLNEILILNAFAHSTYFLFHYKEDIFSSILTRHRKAAETVWWNVSEKFYQLVNIRGNFNQIDAYLQIAISSRRYLLESNENFGKTRQEFKETIVDLMVYLITTYKNNMPGIIEHVFAMCLANYGLLRQADAEAKAKAEAEAEAEDEARYKEKRKREEENFDEEVARIRLRR